MFNCINRLMKYMSTQGRSRFSFRDFHTTTPSTSKRSFYEVLGVKNNATAAEIRDAYVQLSKKYHPDVNKNDKQAHEQFVEINEAYSVLSKNDSRREYDAKMRQGWTSDNGRHQSRDPTRDMYRQYYEQIYRQQRQSRGFSKFEGPYEDPFRDFWRDYGEPFQNQRTTAPGGGRQVKMDENANKAFYMFFVAVFILTIVVHFLQYSMIKSSTRVYEYGDIDRHLEKWSDMIVDRTEDPKQDKSHRKNRDDGFVDV